MLTQSALLLYSSKDSFVKWWDLDTQHCFKTMVGHRSEVRGFLLPINRNKSPTMLNAESAAANWMVSAG